MLLGSFNALPSGSSHVNNAPPDVARHVLQPSCRVLHLDDHGGVADSEGVVGARAHTLARRGQMLQTAADGQPAALRHGMHGFDDEVQQHLLHLGLIEQDRRQVRGHVLDDLDLL